MVNTNIMDDIIFINDLVVEWLNFDVQLRKIQIQIDGLSQDGEFVGNTIYCKCLVDGHLVAGNWSIIQGQAHATINQNGRIDVNQGVLD